MLAIVPYIPHIIAALSSAYAVASEVLPYLTDKETCSVWEWVVKFVKGL